MSSMLLQIFLYLNVFVIGMLVVLGWQHARAHFRPERHAAVEPIPSHAAPEPNRLPSAIKERMLQTAQADFEAAVSRSTAELQRDLAATADRLGKLFDKLGGGIITDETSRYQSVLAQLRTQAEVGISAMSVELSEHRATLQAEAAQQVEAAKQRLLSQIDSKLADAVTSFISDALQYEVDLGAQSAYLLQTLESHKEDLKREVAGEA